MTKAKMGALLLTLLATTSIWARNYGSNDITVGDHKPAYLMSKTQTIDDNYHYNESSKENERNLASEKESDPKGPKFWKVQDKNHKYQEGI